MVLVYGHSLVGTLWPPASEVLVFQEKACARRLSVLYVEVGTVCGHLVHSSLPAPLHPAIMEQKALSAAAVASCRPVVVT
eukprot:1302602-Rhodomonas_salina.1